MARIDKIINDLMMGKTEEEQLLKEQFTFLQEMARAKSETFENKLKAMLGNKEAVGQLAIVGDRPFETHSGQHVNISRSCDDAIMDAINEFFKGRPGVKEGFKILVKNGLSRLIGESCIGKDEEQAVFIFPENYSIVRVDVMAYKYTFSTSLQGCPCQGRGERIRVRYDQVPRRLSEGGHRLPAALCRRHDAQRRGRGSIDRRDHGLHQRAADVLEDA